MCKLYTFVFSALVHVCVHTNTQNVLWQAEVATFLFLFLLLLV